MAGALTQGLRPINNNLWSRGVAALLSLVEILAAVMLAADLVVVVGSVLARSWFGFPTVWSDDVARALLLAVSFLGAAAALARGDYAGVTFFVDRLKSRPRQRVDAVIGLIVVLAAAALFWFSIQWLLDTQGQTVGAGIPQEFFIIPLAFAAAAMVVFALDGLRAHRRGDVVIALALLAGVAGAWTLWTMLAPDSLPDMPAVMGVTFVVCLVIGVPIAFVLALSTLMFV